ncbi:hypothetical protein JOC77_002268 [Peribacillus deserti]|uniref:Uncharacterized protein n=1 Tax=Peribacillus deserti TaxID=673318 RepID=A0ABS2QI64_9BACI|nr:hypothetical protein [Peribacillus deserti]MBM7692837.1 hypothetical protein [Peribacillus deserti]
MRVKPDQAIWMIPSPDFQIEHYSKREWIHSILNQYKEPETAFSNWMLRDIKFAEKISKDADALGLLTKKVDGRRSISQNYEELKNKFKLN